VTGSASIDGACPDQGTLPPSLDYGVARHEDDKDSHGRVLCFLRHTKRCVPGEPEKNHHHSMGVSTSGFSISTKHWKRTRGSMFATSSANSVTAL
jgi:hypothetical protein